MQYKLYTLPHCEKCEAVKKYLKASNIKADEINLGDDEGVAELRRSYSQLKDKIQRNSSGQIPIPLFVAFEGNKITTVVHTLEEVKAFIGS